MNKTNPYRVRIEVERGNVKLILRHRGKKRKDLVPKAKGWFDDNDPLLHCIFYERRGATSSLSESWSRIGDEYLTAMSAIEELEFLTSFGNVLLDFFQNELRAKNLDAVQSRGVRLVLCDKDWFLERSGALP